MVTKGNKDERDSFFFFLQGERAILLKRTLEIDRDIRRLALSELEGLSLLLEDRQTDPRYVDTFSNWRYRLIQAGNPPIFSTMKGLESYYEFLFRHLTPYLKELVFG